MANPLSKLIHPWYPANAIGFEKGLLTMVQLERGKGASTLKRAATVALPESLIRPSFDEPKHFPICLNWPRQSPTWRPAPVCYSANVVGKFARRLKSQPDHDFGVESGSHAELRKCLVGKLSAVSACRLKNCRFLASACRLTHRGKIVI